MKRRTRGFTAMELLVTLAIAAVVFAVGMPSFRNFVRNGRLTGAANELLITYVKARNEAVRQQTIVSVCPSANPEDALAATCTGGASTGYIAFIDPDGSCLRDGVEVGDPNNVVAYELTHNEVTATRNGTCVSFAANGFRRIVAGQPTTSRAMFCDSRGNAKIFPTSTISYARGVEVLPTGRASVSRLYAELGGWSGGGTPVTCP